MERIGLFGVIPTLALSAGAPASAAFPPPVEDVGTRLQYQFNDTLLVNGQIIFDSNPGNNSCGPSVGAVNSYSAGVGVYTASGDGCPGSPGPVLPTDGAPILATNQAFGQSTTDCSVSLTASSGVNGGPFYASWDVSGSGEVGPFLHHGSSGSFGGDVKSYDGYVAYPICDYCGHKTDITSGFGDGGASVSYRFANEVTIRWNVSYSLTGFAQQETKDSCGGETRYDVLANIPEGVIRFTKVVISSASGSPVSYQGLYGRDANGNVVRYGTLSDAEFDVTNTSTQAIIDGEVSNSLEMSSTSFDITSEIKAFKSLTGDYDGDGVVSRPELLSWVPLYGTVFGEADYTPQLDLNLDGVIDQTDGDLAWAAICHIDFNGDGNVDQGDVDAILNSVANGEPFTDVNDDGNSDQSDVDFILNAVSSSGGC